MASSIVIERKRDPGGLGIEWALAEMSAARLSIAINRPVEDVFGVLTHL